MKDPRVEQHRVASQGTYRLASGEPQTRVDLTVTALTDPLASRVAPHGLIGQGFDGRYIEGQKDDYVPDGNGMVITTAQGEGAIEGAVADYVVDSPFSTAFAFGRFSASEAPPRQLHVL